MKANEWDTSYEWKAVTLLALGFGLVGLDRWLIAPLFPSIMKDLNLNAQDVGNCIGVLGLSWGIFAALMGGISDKIGRRKVLIPAIIAFSLLSGFAAGGLLGLMAIRGLMGVAEGSFCPTSFAATADASHPRRRGLNLGLQQSGFALFARAVADHRDAAARLRVVALGLCARRRARPDPRRDHVVRDPRAEGHEGRRVGACAGVARPCAQEPQHPRGDGRLVLRDDGRIRARRAVAAVPDRLPGARHAEDGPRRVGDRFRRFLGQFGLPGLSDRSAAASRASSASRERP